MTTGVFLVLAGILVALVCLLAWQMTEGRKERAKLLNLLISKNPQEAAILQAVDNSKTEKNNPPPDLVPEDSLTQEQLQVMIKKGIV